MQLHRPMGRIGDRLATVILCSTILGCGGQPTTESGDEDSESLPDLPNETSEYAGILYGLNFDALPSRFEECETGEVFELVYGTDFLLKGSCYGVYNRIRGVLDRDFDPPRLFVHETLEARWCEPLECAIECTPMYESCAIEDTPDSLGGDIIEYPCAPVSGTCDETRCAPDRFDATEIAGWKDFDCDDVSGADGPGEACEYSGDTDTCIDTFRCWNSEGDLTKPGVCVRYCDLTDAADPCAGECVRCSSSDKWGLCMPDCSGEDCNVDAFC